MKVSVSAVVYEEDGIWIIQGIDHDIVATAKNQEEITKSFAKAIIANLEINRQLGREGLSGIPEAPAKFKEVFERSKFGLLPQASFETNDISIHDLRLAPTS